MPSIELVAIDQEEPFNCSSLPFKVKVNSELVSHRCPSPLFQSDFDALEGHIYHLLDGGVTAYDLLKRDWYDVDGNSNGMDENIEFRDEYKSSVVHFISELLESSGKHIVLFTSDYQFGPAVTQRYGQINVKKFWDLHDSGSLRMNTSYLITQS